MRVKPLRSRGLSDTLTVGTEGNNSRRKWNQTVNCDSISKWHFNLNKPWNEKIKRPKSWWRQKVKSSLTLRTGMMLSPTEQPTANNNSQRPLLSNNEFWKMMTLRGVQTYPNCKWKTDQSSTLFSQALRQQRWLSSDEYLNLWIPTFLLTQWVEQTF